MHNWLEKLSPEWGLLIYQCLWGSDANHGIQSLRSESPSTSEIGLRGRFWALGKGAVHACVGFGIKKGNKRDCPLVRIRVGAGCNVLFRQFVVKQAEPPFPKFNCSGTVACVLRCWVKGVCTLRGRANSFSCRVLMKENKPQQYSCINALQSCADCAVRQSFGSHEGDL